MFTESQIEALTQKLKAEYVKTRPQGGKTLSFIEGHHVIREANRLFGHGNWNLCVHKLDKIYDRVDGSKTHVAYSAAVSVEIRGRNGQTVIREDVGVGMGQNMPIMQAHELAMKEAVTDGMKRCFRTFGDQFGLALYDTTQVNVESEGDAYVRLAEEVLDLMTTEQD